MRALGKAAIRSAWSRGSRASVAEADFVVTKAPALAGAVLIKVGTLDDPSVFGKPDMVIFTCDKQDFHQLPEGVPTFERGPA